MVMLVWWILSLFGVCSFGWLPVMIDAIITTIACVVMNNDSEEDKLSTDIICIVSIGVAIYAFCAQFLSLALPFWCVFISPVWFLVAFFVPGGFTITNVIFNVVGIMSVPLWVFIVGGVVDAIVIAILIYDIVSHVRNK